MTGKEEVFHNGALKIEKRQSDSNLTLVLSGKSILRDANETLLPVFTKSLDEATTSSRRLVLDFRPVTYMNSSSFAPVIKILEKARLGTTALSVIYSSHQKWQEVSFTAMTIFRTPDGRITISGEDDEGSH